MACTFCGLGKDEVATLVAGPGVYICGDCVALAEQVIGEARQLDGGTAEHLAVGLACSFCGKPDTDVQRLIVGPDVRICDQCVGLCVEVCGLS